MSCFTPQIAKTLAEQCCQKIAGGLEGFAVSFQAETGSCETCRDGIVAHGAFLCGSRMLQHFYGENDAEAKAAFNAAIEVAIADLLAKFHERRRRRNDPSSN